MEKQEQTRHGGRMESNRWRWNLSVGNMESRIHQGVSCAVCLPAVGTSCSPQGSVLVGAGDSLAT